jgi:acyl-CoA synthetase (NDP forming)
MLIPVRRAIENAHAKYPERLIVLVIVAPDDVVRRYEEAGCLVFEDPTRAVRAVAALNRIQGGFETPFSPPSGAAHAAPGSFPGTPLGERQSKRLLADAGLPVIEDRLARTGEEAAAAAEALGLPVVMKIASLDIPHKTEVDGIRLGIDSVEGARASFRALMDDVRRQRPDARLDGVLVSPMMSGGIETILGIHRDPVFGPVVMFGLGGVWVEVLDDVSFRVAPFDEDEARRMVFESRASAVLNGTRGKGPYDLPALFAALARLSQFAVEHADSIESVDMNPFLVMPQGQGGIALDALVVPRQA